MMVTEFIIEKLEEMNLPIIVEYDDVFDYDQENLDNKYDGIILDMDNYPIKTETIEKMRENNKNIPIIIFSNNIDGSYAKNFNVEAILKKKQSEYEQIKDIFEKFL